MEEDIRALITVLHAAHPAQRYLAEETLLKNFGHEATPYLIEELSSAPTSARLALVRLLGVLADRRAVAPLIEIVRNEDLATSPSGLWNSVAGNAIWSLGQIGDAQAVDILIEALNHPNFHYLAATALGRIGDPRAVQPLLVVLRQFKDASIATVLGNLGYAEAVIPMIAELELLREPMTTAQIDKIWGGQHWRDIYFYYVAHGLGKLGDDRALPMLEWARDHEQEPVLKGRSIGYKAARAIERIRASQKLSDKPD